MMTEDDALLEECGGPRLLGGFKVLDHVVWAALDDNATAGVPALEFCRLLSGRRINLPFFSFECTGPCAFWNMVLPAYELSAEERVGMDGAVLSVFPHRNDPAVAGRFFTALGRSGVWPYAVACSPGALSAVIPAEAVPQTTRAIFGPFRFGAWRTPEEWCQAHQGQEQLYKEVVASFQEQRPKVYGLRWTDGLLLFSLTMSPEQVATVGRTLAEDSTLPQGGLPFLMSSPLDHHIRLLLCVPAADHFIWAAALGRHAPQEVHAKCFPAALFTMNGPHFGDRYGIVSTLLHGLQQSGVELLALNCSVASITGLVPPGQIQAAIEAISTCFDVPAVIRID